jgi:hypothetical protein
MDSERLSSLVSRTFVFVSFGLLALAVLEKLCNSFGYTLLRGLVPSSHLLEYAVVLLMFVVALVLRQVRDRLHNP